MDQGFKSLLPYQGERTPIQCVMIIMINGVVAYIRSLIQAEDEKVLEFIVWHLGCLKDGELDMEFHGTTHEKYILCNVWHESTYI